MQVASTLWPDIKSQKISERRFRLKWIKCSPRTNPNEVKTGQPQRGSDKEAQYSLPEEVWGGWWPGQADRPTWSADLARGPHHLSQATCRLLVGPLGRFGESYPVEPSYKYKWGGRDYDTHTHTTLPLLSCTSCIVFRLSGVQKKSRSLRVAGSARESSMGSSLALSCNIRLFVIELDYGYRYLLEVCSELSDICFLIWLRYHTTLALHDRLCL